MFVDRLCFALARLSRITALCVLGAAAPSFAGMEQSMNAQFNAMVNVTPAGTYETQAAKVISGGSFVYRPRVAQLRLLAIDPPRIRADCNGIDAYAGSLSFISKEQFINFLRNLAAAAPAYAFNLALSYICKDCDQHLARLQKLAQDVNALTINSCKIDAGQMAKQVRTIANDIDDIVGNEKNLGNYLSGLSTDYFGPRQDPLAPKTLNAAAAGGNAAAQAVVREVNVNIAKAAAENSALGDWWGAILPGPERAKFDEVLMSFLGAIVTKSVVPSDDPAAEKDQTFFLPPLLKFTDFIYGGPRDIYKCPDTDCLITPDSPKQVYDLPSFRKKVEDILIGNGPGAPGVIAKLNHRASTGGSSLTDAEKAFVGGLPGGVYAHLREMALYPSAAETFARTLSTWIASEIAYEYLSQNIFNARVSAEKAKAKLLQKEWTIQLDQIEAQISEARARFSDTLKSQHANLGYAQMIRENLSRATAVGLRPGSFGPSN